MKRTILSMGVAVLLAATTATAQEPAISPVWEYFNTSTDSPLPILTVTPPDTRSIGDAGQGEGPLNGLATNDSYGGFARYDEDRLILAIRENGIDESDPSHDAALAAQFPDRSLIFIDPSDGSPLGVALVVGQTPVPVSDEFVALQVSNGRGLNGGVGPAEYFNFGVSDDGMIYVGYFYHIIRYAPDGNGGFSDPEIVYSFNDGEDPGLDRWDQWRFEDIEVSGSGADTVIVAGGKTWRPEQRVRVLETTDGDTFSVRGGFFGDGGGNSRIIEFEGDQFVYNAQYPGTGGGPGNTFKRFLFDGNEWLEDPLFTFDLDPEADGITTSAGDYIHDVEVNENFPEYIFGLASPSYGGDVTTPGFINIYSQDFLGEPARLLSYHLQDVTREGEPYNGNVPFWFSTMGDIEVNVLEGFAPGSAEILFYSGLYGYGRYTIGDTSVTEWSLY